MKALNMIKAHKRFKHQIQTSIGAVYGDGVRFPKTNLVCANCSPFEVLFSIISFRCSMWDRKVSAGICFVTDDLHCTPEAHSQTKEGWRSFSMLGASQLQRYWRLGEQTNLCNVRSFLCLLARSFICSLRRYDVWLFVCLLVCSFVRLCGLATIPKWNAKKWNEGKWVRKGTRNKCNDLLRNQWNLKIMKQHPMKTKRNAKE